MHGFSICHHVPIGYYSMKITASLMEKRKLDQHIIIFFTNQEKKGNISFNSLLIFLKKSEKSDDMKVVSLQRERLSNLIEIVGKKIAKLT